MTHWLLSSYNMSLSWHVATGSPIFLATNKIPLPPQKLWLATCLNLISHCMTTMAWPEFF